MGFRGTIEFDRSLANGSSAELYNREEKKMVRKWLNRFLFASRDQGSPDKSGVKKVAPPSEEKESDGPLAEDPRTASTTVGGSKWSARMACAICVGSYLVLTWLGIAENTVPHAACYSALVIAYVLFLHSH
jgi:hypothetical protein